MTARADGLRLSFSSKILESPLASSVYLAH